MLEGLMQFLHAERVSRAVSAFDHANRRWAVIPLRNSHDPFTQRPSCSRPADVHVVGKQTLSLTSWNIQAAWSRPAARSEFILDHIFKGPKFLDIVFLQRVTSSVRESLLSDPRVQSSFLTTDAEDATSCADVPFASMTLLSSKRFGSPSFAQEEGQGGYKIALDSVFRMGLVSRHKPRDALCVNIASPAAPGKILRLLNVHLEPLDGEFRRSLQMSVLAGLLREAGCSGGIIAGDSNAVLPEDHALVDRHKLADVWVALHGTLGGHTWGVGVEPQGGLKPGRLDKVVMLGLQPEEIEILRPAPYQPWRDHCGLRCTFSI